MTRRSSLLLGVVAGAALGWGAHALFYLNWRPLVAPLDQDALVIRADAKGDGRFGAPRSGNRRHRGVDLEAPLGSPVRAIRSGVVVEIGVHRGLGRFVELEHPQHLRSLYGHLETVNVRVGDRVRQGQTIATVGKTGNARNRLIKPHLHLEVLRQGEPIDPARIGLVAVEPATPSTDAVADGGE